MNRGMLALACVLLLTCCSREDEPAKVAAATATTPPLDASARVDMALMHDFELAREGARKLKWRPPFPALPALAEDAAFLRRACIDLAGRLPQADEARQFLADKSPGKRTALTDALLKEPGAAELRYRMLAEAFRVTDADPEVIAWLRQAAREDRPYAEIITHMIGGGHMSQRDGGNALHTAMETAHSLLGKDFYCAMCHDHPFNDYTQFQCFSFAACFSDKDPVRLPVDYKYLNHEPNEVVQPGLPPVDRRYGLGVDEGHDKVQQVAQWITREEGTRSYALVAALRVWKSLFGMPGLIASQGIGGVDSAAPWHGIPPRSRTGYSRDCFGVPPLQQPTWLALDINSPSDFSQAPKVLIEEFLRSGGRIGEFQRILARTQAYGRSAHAPSMPWEGCYLVPSPQIRRLPSEIIWTVCGGETDAVLREVPPTGHPLRMLGRGTREWADESLTPVSHALVHFMMTQPVADSPPVQASSTDDLFLTLLGRQPAEAERAAISRHEASSQDIAWALLNTAEFMFRP